MKAEMPQKLILNNKTIKNPQEICDEINKYVVDVGEKLSAIVAMNTCNVHHKKVLGKWQISSIVLQPTDEYELLKIKACLNSHKSSGYLDIPTTLLKESKCIIM